MASGEGIQFCEQCYRDFAAELFKGALHDLIRSDSHAVKRDAARFLCEESVWHGFLDLDAAELCELVKQKAAAVDAGAKWSAVFSDWRRSVRKVEDE